MDFIPVPGGDMPEELRQKMEEAHARHEMMAEEYRHSTQRLWDELNEEQLVTMRNLMHNLAMGGSPLGFYYEGQIAQAAYLRFNICPGCAVDHNKDLPQETVQQKPREWSEEELDQMELYNLDDAYDEETREFVGFVCKGCGLRYPSIEDRMRKPPGVEGCGGCIHKAKFG
jgi:predicted esterase YcpF (UPF0227 family)